MPGDLNGSRPPSQVAQGEEDLKRTREVLYGRALTEEEHARIASWRTWDPDWWLDKNREAEAFAALDSLDQRFGTRTYAEAKAVKGSLEELGVEIAYVDEALVDEKTGVTAGLIRATWSGVLRPDLYPIHQGVHAVVLERQRQKADGAGGPSAWSGVPFGVGLSEDDLDEMARVYLMSVNLLVGANLELLRRDMEVQRAAAGGTLSTEALRELAARYDRLERRTWSSETRRFLDRLPPETASSLVSKAADHLLDRETVAVFAPRDSATLLMAAAAEGGAS